MSSTITGNQSFYYRTINGLQSFTGDSIICQDITADDANFDTLQVNISSNLNGTTTIQNANITTLDVGQLQIGGYTVIDSSKNIDGNTYEINGVQIIDSSKNANLNSLAINSSSVIDSSKNIDANSYDINTIPVIDVSRNIYIMGLYVNGFFTMDSSRNCHLYNLDINNQQFCTFNRDVYANDINCQDIQITGDFRQSSTLKFIEFVSDINLSSCSLLVSNGNVEISNGNLDITNGSILNCTDIIASNDVTIDTNVFCVRGAINSVGINTATPSTSFHVVGETTLQGGCKIDGNTLVVDSINNRCGVRTAVPSVELDITGSAKISSTLNVLSTLQMNSVNFVDASRNITCNAITSSTGNLNIVAGNLQMNSNTCIDTSRNITAGTLSCSTINCTAITATGNYLSTNNNITLTNGTMTCNTLSVTGSATITNDLTLDTNTIKTDATNNRVGIVKTTPLSTLHVGGSVRLDQGLHCDGYINSNTRDFIKLQTNRPGIYYRAARLGTGVSTSVHLCNNVNRDTGTLAKDSNTYGATNFIMNENGSFQFEVSLGSGAISLTNIAGCDGTNPYFYIRNDKTTQRYPLLHENANRLTQSGEYTGGSATGSITFPVAYTSAPNVTATIVSTNTSNLYSIHIHTITTTSFQFIKKYQNGSTTSDATSENFQWISVGSIN